MVPEQLGAGQSQVSPSRYAGKGGFCGGVPECVLRVRI